VMLTAGAERGAAGWSCARASEAAQASDATATIWLNQRRLPRPLNAPPRPLDVDHPPKSGEHALVHHLESVGCGKTEAISQPFRDQFFAGWAVEIGPAPRVA